MGSQPVTRLNLRSVQQPPEHTPPLRHRRSVFHLRLSLRHRPSRAALLVLIFPATTPLVLLFRWTSNPSVQGLSRTQLKPALAPRPWLAAAPTAPEVSPHSLRSPDARTPLPSAPLLDTNSPSLDPWPNLDPAADLPNRALTPGCHLTLHTHSLSPSRPHATSPSLGPSVVLPRSLQPAAS